MDNRLPRGDVALRFVSDLLTFILSSLSHFTSKQLTMTVGGGLFLAVLCAAASGHYTSLWNKRYRLRLTQKLLCVIAAVSTFLFAITFVAFAFLNDTVDREISTWENQLKSNESFLLNTYQLAYYAVKSRNLEDFSGSPPPEQGGTTFPVTNDESRQVTGEVYATEAYRNFAD